MAGKWKTYTAFGVELTIQTLYRSMALNGIDTVYPSEKNMGVALISTFKGNMERMLVEKYMIDTKEKLVEIIGENCQANEPDDDAALEALGFPPFDDKKTEEAPIEAEKNIVREEVQSIVPEKRIEYKRTEVIEEPPTAAVRENKEPQKIVITIDEDAINKAELANKFPKHPAVERVHHPAHYNAGTIEVWDAIVDWQLPFLEGNVVKYIARAGRKNDKLEDLKKAKEYIEKLIEVEEAKGARA